MSKNWHTKNKDLHIARMIIEHYAESHQTEALGLLDWVFKPEEKRMDFEVADWVHVLANQFMRMYGDSQGDFVTRNVVSQLMISGAPVH